MTVDDILGLLHEVKITGVVRPNQRSVRISCPFASLPNSGHKSSVDLKPSADVTIGLDDNVFWFCFGCGRRGTFRSFFQTLEVELGYKCFEIIQKLDRILDKDPEEIYASIPDYDVHFRTEERDQYPLFPETWLSAYSGKVPRYILDRGVRLSTCKEWGIGFDRIDHRVFYPVRDRDNRLVGAVGGSVRKAILPKYRNMWAKLHSCLWPVDSRSGTYYCGNCDREVKFSDVHDGFKKSRFLYGEHRATIGGTPVITEGVIDTLRVYQATHSWKDGKYFPLGLLGSSISKEQAEKIVRLAGDTVVSFLDNDAAGAKGTKELKEYLLRRVRFFKASYPDGFNDPGEMDDDQIREAILNAKVYFS